MQNFRHALLIASFAYTIVASGICFAQDRRPSYRIVGYESPPADQIPITGFPLRISNPSYPNMPYVEPWPRDASGTLLTGVVTLLILVDMRGDVQKVTVEISSGHSLLDTMGADAARGWHFTPELKNGVATNSYVRVPINISGSANTEPTNAVYSAATYPATLAKFPSEIFPRETVSGQVTTPSTSSQGNDNETPDPTIAPNQRGGAFGRGVVAVAGFAQKASLYFLEGLVEGAGQQRVIGQRAAIYSALTPSYVATAYWTGRQTQVTTVTYKVAWNCEYNYNGQTFGRIFEHSCPSSVKVQ